MLLIASSPEDVAFVQGSEDLPGMANFEQEALRMARRKRAVPGPRLAASSVLGPPGGMLLLGMSLRVPSEPFCCSAGAVGQSSAPLASTLVMLVRALAPVVSQLSFPCKSMQQFHLSMSQVAVM